MVIFYLNIFNLTKKKKMNNNNNKIIFSFTKTKLSIIIYQLMFST